VNSGARVCALLATAMITYLADRPCFLGDIGQVHPHDGVISIDRGAATIHYGQPGHRAPDLPASRLARPLLWARHLLGQPGRRRRHLLPPVHPAHPDGHRWRPGTCCTP